MTRPLSEEERAMRDQCIEVIVAGAKTCLMVMNAIIVAEERQLYRETHPNLKAWLDSILPAGLITPRYSYHLIQAAKTEAARQMYAPETPAPVSERSLRPLADIPQPEDRAQVWKEASKIAKENGREAPIERDTRRAKSSVLGSDGEEQADLAMTGLHKGHSVTRRSHWFEPSLIRGDRAGKRLFLTPFRPPNHSHGEKTNQKLARDIPLLIRHLEEPLRQAGFKLVPIEGGDDDAFAKD